MEIQLDTPIEVNKSQYDTIQQHLQGYCAFQIKDGKYFVKVWHPYAIERVKNIIKA